MTEPTGGFEAGWLAARRPYDTAALDHHAIAAIQAWASAAPTLRRLTVVDLASGTGVALRRATHWLAPHPLVSYAVDADATLLAQIDIAPVTPLLGDLLGPLDRLGGPPDASVDLVLGHAVADLLPLDRLALRVAALLRPGGLAHLALTYDGLTAFAPRAGTDLDERVVGAFHQQMDRHVAREPAYGGSTAGRRVAPALASAGLKILHDAPSAWQVAASDGPSGRAVLDRLIRYVVEAARASGSVGEDDLGRWERFHRGALLAATLTAQVRHRDVLAQKVPN